MITYTAWECFCAWFYRIAERNMQYLVHFRTKGRTPQFRTDKVIQYKCGSIFSYNKATCTMIYPICCDPKLTLWNLDPMFLRFFLLYQNALRFHYKHCSWPHSEHLHHPTKTIMRNIFSTLHEHNQNNINRGLTPWPDDKTPRGQWWQLSKTRGKCYVCTLWQNAINLLLVKAQ